VAAESFPGVSGLIAFTSNRDGNDEIYFMAADGSGQTRLTTNPAVDHPYCLGSMLSSNGALTKMTSPISEPTARSSWQPHAFIRHR
jgi:Tol biopolymer transport system component